MRRRFAAATITFLAALLALAGAISPVSAADQPIWTYFSQSGGTQANLIGKIVNSDLTGASNLGGTAFVGESSNGVAKVSVPGIIEVGAITTSQVASPFKTDGLQITSKAKIAGIDLLSGAIKVDAIETTNIGRATPTGFSKVAKSKLATLTIAGKSYPLTARPNTTITIPGLATVVINEQISNSGPSGLQTKVNALRVTLLEDFAGAKLGSTIRLAPSSINILNGGPSNAIPVGGFCYGLAAKVKAADVSVAVPPLPYLTIPSIGTGGRLFTNSTANVDIPQGLLKVGALECSVSGLSEVGAADAYAETEIARANLLNGVIRADAIKVKSHVSKTQSGSLEEQSMEFVNLRVAGKLIPIDVKPNTRINVLGLGQVNINKQMTQSGYSAIIGVEVILSVKKLGLPVGAQVHLGVASTYTAASE
jgi:hypothetical protein